MWRKTKHSTSKNGKKIKAKQRDTERATTTQHNSWKTLLHYFSFLSCASLFRKIEKSVVSSTRFVVARSHLLSRRAHNTTQFYLIFFSAFACFVGRRGSVCVCMVEDFVSFLSLRSLSCVCVSGFGPESEYNSRRWIFEAVLLWDFYLFPSRTFMSLHFFPSIDLFLLVH
jgi:hypothetical protein